MGGSRFTDSEEKVKRQNELYTNFSDLTWEGYERNPVLSPPALSPIIADPTFLFPEESPDNLWHLFAHSIHGIHSCTSRDGLSWSKPKLLMTNAMRPFIFRDGEWYYLFYEKIRPAALYTGWLPRKWYSLIMLKKSKDLRKWTRPQLVLAPTLPWHRDPVMGSSVGNPCLVKKEDHYHLYFSASLIRLPDCGFNEPLFLGLAISEKPEGPFIVRKEPVQSPDPENPYRNHSCGSIKAVYSEGRFKAIQNGIYLDREGKTGSALLSLTSANGIDWEQTSPEPVLAPSGEGWMKSHIYALDVKKREADNQWWLFYNARDDWHWTKGRERIGLLFGKI